FFSSTFFLFFFFTDTSTTEIYTLSLHDALPIFTVVFLKHRERHVHAGGHAGGGVDVAVAGVDSVVAYAVPDGLLQLLEIPPVRRSEEHTSELQSRGHLVCRLLLEKKKNDALSST